jgi:hypothetical protein
VSGQSQTARLKDTRIGTIGRQTLWGVARRFERLRYLMWCLPRRPDHFVGGIRLLGAYKQRGWFQSLRTHAPVDRSGKSLPWLTYAAIDWLDSVLRAEHRVFEYGMGGSTVWMAARVQSVSSVDTNAEYVAHFPVPPNAHVTIAECGGTRVHAEPGDPYVSTIERQESPFDVVLIDGAARLSCVEPAHRALAPDGLIIFDNTDIPTYQPALRQLGDLGYLRIDFFGTRPLYSMLGCTSVFSRDMAKWLRDATPPHYWGRSINEFPWH